jgi:predicted dehydrogenase
VVGDRGTLIFDEMQPSTPLLLYPGTFTPAGIYFTPTGGDREVIPIPDGEPLKQVCQHFIHCATTHQPSPLSSGQVGTDLVRILVALSQSLKAHGQMVSLKD